MHEDILREHEVFYTLFRFGVWHSRPRLCPKGEITAGGGCATFLILLCLLGNLFLSGCIYKSPITDAPSRKIDERLFGTWRATKEGDLMKVMRLSDREYFVEYRSASDKKTCYFRAYHSTINDVDILNAQDVGATPVDKTGYFAFFTYEINKKGDLILNLVLPDLPEESASSFAIRREIKKGLGAGSLESGDNPVIFRKIKSNP